MPGPTRGELRVIDLTFPHQVDLAIPETGFGHERMNEMHAFVHGMKRSGTAGARRKPPNTATWCFASAADADAFASAFGGQRVDMSSSRGGYGHG